MVSLDIDIIRYKNQLKYKKEANQLFVWDRIRAKYVLLTPEELVRQCMIHHLILDLGYSASLIQVERKFKVFYGEKRFDILVYNRQVEPKIIIECKRLKVPITQNVMEQISIYNHDIHAPVGIVTNGREIICYAVDFEDKSYSFLEAIPGPNY